MIAFVLALLGIALIAGGVALTRTAYTVKRAVLFWALVLPGELAVAASVLVTMEARR